MRRVLIICADPYLTAMLRLTLSDAGYDPITAVTSVSALEILKNLPGPFIIIVDGIHSNAESIDVLKALPKSKKLSTHHLMLILNGGTMPYPVPIQKIIERFAIPILHVPFAVDDFLRLLATLSAQMPPPAS